MQGVLLIVAEYLEHYRLNFDVFDKRSIDGHGDLEEGEIFKINNCDKRVGQKRCNTYILNVIET